MFYRIPAEARPFLKTRPMEYVRFFVCVSPPFAGQLGPYFLRQVFVGEICRCPLVRRTYTFHRHDLPFEFGATATWSAGFGETNGEPRGLQYDCLSSLARDWRSTDRDRVETRTLGLAIGDVGRRKSLRLKYGRELHQHFADGPQVRRGSLRRLLQVSSKHRG